MLKLKNPEVESNSEASETKNQDEDYVPQELLDAAAEAVEESLPDKSKRLYKESYHHFLQWMSNKKTKSFSEAVFLAYFKELSTKMSPVSLWPKYSMLRAMVNKEKNIDITTYTQLRTYLKKLNTGVKSKKSKTFTAQEMKKFLNEAPNENYLDTKVAMIIGVSGACRRQELHDLRINHVKDENNHLFVTLSDTKTHVMRTFTVNNPLREVVVEYMSLRPTDVDGTRFFVNYQKGKCTKQFIGINKIGAMPQKIAEWLNLPTPNLYTGHSFRRTSASLLADAGASIQTLKRHGGWKSTEVAEGYVEQSLANKKKICNQIIEGLVDEESCDTAASSSIKRIKLNETKNDSVNEENKNIKISASTDNSSFSLKVDNCNVP